MKKEGMRDGEGEGRKTLGKRGGRGGGGNVTFPTNHLVAVVFGRQGLEGGFDDAAAETEDEVEGGFLVSTNK